MEGTIPSPAWASHVYFHLRRTDFSLALPSPLSIVCLKNSHRKHGFFVPIPQAFLSVHRRIPLRKRTSAQDMGFRCEGLGSCNIAANNYSHLHSLHPDCQKLIILQITVSNCCDKLHWGKDQLEKSWSALWMIDSWGLFRVARTAASIKCQCFLF